MKHLVLGASLTRMTAFMGGHVRFIGITFGKWGFGFIKWNPKESLARRGNE